MDSTIAIILVILFLACVVAVVLLRRGGGGGVVVVPPRPSHGGAPGGDDISKLLASGNKITAIKLVRERTGWGLKEAKDYVDALEAGQPVAPLSSSAAPAPAPAFGPPNLELEQAVRVMLLRGNKIEAIKLVREQTGWGLKEAKDYVDRL